MREIWARIEGWLRQHAPDALGVLYPPAPPETIRAFETAVGAALPDDYRESLAIHDGEQGSPVLFSPWALTATEWAVRSWRTMRSVERELARDLPRRVPVVVVGPVAAVWWSESWIPFASNGAGYDLCLDLDPAPGGRRGQVIEFRHDISKRIVRAPSFADWLRANADDLENGRYEIDEDGFPQRIEELPED